MQGLRLRSGAPELFQQLTQAAVKIVFLSNGLDKITIPVFTTLLAGVIDDPIIVCNKLISEDIGGGSNDGRAIPKYWMEGLHGPGGVNKAKIVEEYIAAGYRVIGYFGDDEIADGPGGLVAHDAGAPVFSIGKKMQNSLFFHMRRHGRVSRVYAVPDFEKVPGIMAKTEILRSAPLHIASGNGELEKIA